MRSVELCGALCRLPPSSSIFVRGAHRRSESIDGGRPAQVRTIEAAISAAATPRRGFVDRPRHVRSLGWLVRSASLTRGRACGGRACGRRAAAPRAYEDQPAEEMPASPRTARREAVARPRGVPRARREARAQGDASGGRN